MRAPLRFRLILKRLADGDGGRGRDGERVVDRLAVRAGMRVADIGSGSGAFAVRFATAVGPTGRVLAVDVDPDLVAVTSRIATERGLPQLVPVAAVPDDPRLQEPVDLVFLSASFHHLRDPVAWFGRLRSSLTPGATVVVLETRPGPLSGWFGHATRPEDVRATMESAGYRLVWRDDVVRFSSLQAFADGGAPGATCRRRPLGALPSKLCHLHHQTHPVTRCSASLVVPWNAGSVRIRHDDPALRPYSPHASVLPAAMTLVVTTEGRQRVLGDAGRALPRAGQGTGHVPSACRWPP